MKKLNKKAIFAAMMGALSSVSSFAMENKDKKSPGRPIDNEQLFSKKNRLKILDKGDFDFNNQLARARLEEIFTEISEIELENFDADLLPPGFITNRLKIQNWLEDFASLWVEVKSKKGALKGVEFKPFHLKFDGETIEAGLNIDESNKRKKTIQKEKQNRMDSFQTKNRKYLIHEDLGGKIDGFVEFEQYENGGIFIHDLANRVSKNGIGIGGSMISYLKKKFSSIEVTPEGENAESFYKHCGFKKGGFGMIWLKKIKF